MPTQAPSAAGFQTAATRFPAETSTATPGMSGMNQEAGTGVWSSSALICPARAYVIDHAHHRSAAGEVFRERRQDQERVDMRQREHWREHLRQGIDGAEALQRRDGDQRQHQHRNGAHRDLERLGAGVVDDVQYALGTFGAAVVQRLVERPFRCDRRCPKT